MLRPLVPPGTSIIDVGANVGEFTLEFARWVSDGGRVYAFEPEPANFRHLVERLHRAGLAGRVEAVRAAVADVDGELRLTVSRDHPGDHHLGGSGIAVEATTVDAFVEQLGRLRISLIKIDVQGAELRALAGARRTLESQHPALHLEVDDESLRRSNTNARELLEHVAAYRYEIRRLSRKGLSKPLSLEQVLEQQADEGYLDLVMLPPPGGG